MRITTQMLNETARKTGLPVNNSSLLNYVNKKDNNSLLGSLQNSMTQKSDIAKNLMKSLKTQQIRLRKQQRRSRTKKGTVFLQRQKRAAVRQRL